jgi:hypothetical protein
MPTVPSCVVRRGASTEHGRSRHCCASNHCGLHRSRRAGCQLAQVRPGEGVCWSGGTARVLSNGVVIVASCIAVAAEASLCSSAHGSGGRQPRPAALCECPVTLSLVHQFHPQSSCVLERGAQMVVLMDEFRTVSPQTWLVCKVHILRQVGRRPRSACTADSLVHVSVTPRAAWRAVCAARVARRRCRGCRWPRRSGGAVPACQRASRPCVLFSLSGVVGAGSCSSCRRCVCVCGHV